MIDNYDDGDDVNEDDDYEMIMMLSDAEVDHTDNVMMMIRIKLSANQNNSHTGKVSVNSSKRHELLDLIYRVIQRTPNG